VGENRKRTVVALAALSMLGGACGGQGYGKAAAAPEAMAPPAFASEAAPASPDAVAAAGAPAATPGAAPGAPSSGPPFAPPSVSDVKSGVMLIYTAELSMAVFQVEASLAAVEKIGRDVGGYLSARQDKSVTIRVPRDRFDEAVDRVEHLGDVTHRAVKAHDVTDEYVDVEARLKNARAMRDRLADLLSHATVKEALDIERELSRVTEDIERLEGRLKLLRDEVAFSTISVDFAPVAVQEVHDASILSSIPWLRELGLPTLLGGHL
jgi:hypothetical protein